MLGTDSGTSSRRIAHLCNDPIKLLDFVHRPDFYKQKTQRFGNRSSFRNVVFSDCRNPDDGQSPEA
jgi:hypothetical protein